MQEFEMEREERRTADARLVLQFLEEAGFAARWAGGCVRDRLLGRIPEDFDIATTATPEETIRIFRLAGRKTIPTGLEHGTVTVVMTSGPFEVTTLRRDIETDGRHARVAFGTSFEEDAARRDFTINAMFEDARGQVYDYFGGREDLAKGCLRFVGTPEVRIREDYLRILRFFRFWAKLQFRPDPSALAAVAAEKAGLSQVSQERITGEIMKTLAGPAAWEAVSSMRAMGLWTQLFPEIGTGAISNNFSIPEALFTEISRVSAPRRGLAMLAGLCLWDWEQSSSEEWRDLGGRLRLSRAETRAFAFFPTLTRRLETLGPEPADALLCAEDAETQGGPEAFASFYAPVLLGVQRAGESGEPCNGTRAALRQITVTDETLGHRRRQSLPVSGQDIVAILGQGPGPEVGQLREALRRAYLNGEWHSRDEGLAWLRRATLG